MRLQTPHDSDYETCHYTHAWLRIMSDDFDIEEVTSLVGTEPTNTQKNGEVRSEKTGKTFKKTGWFISSEGTTPSKDSRDHLDFVLAKLEIADDGLKELHDRGFLIDLCVRWDSKSGHGGPTLSPSQMSRLAELEIELWFDVYFHGDDFLCEGETPPPTPPKGEQGVDPNA